MTRSSDDGQQPKRRNWVSPLAPDASTAARTAFTRAGFSDPTLVLRWDEIAGPETARLARPVRLSEGPNGGVLTLKAEPGAALFLQHETRPLCERINAYLGRPAVSRLRFVQGPLIPRHAPSMHRTLPGTIPPADPVEKYHGPEGLREALRNLARIRRSRTNMGS
ncbi:MAG: DUF721 domain-containing protein [Alphaproteobacteria bacterium]|nr:DUF721 domain-containing protein [Alphaproteobacteria bacterium]MDE2630358.1 DUF721 domain-containing protein [Alphaproteobacteria bacterium]